jgi:hypothetical protein
MSKTRVQQLDPSRNKPATMSLEGEFRAHRNSPMNSDSMEHRPSWEPNRFLATQEITRILWNPSVHNRIHNSPPSVPVLNQIKTFFAPSHFLKIHLRLGLPSGFFPSGFPTKTLYADRKSR